MILKSRIIRKWWVKEERFTKTTKGKEMRNGSFESGDSSNSSQ